MARLRRGKTLRSPTSMARSSGTPSRSAATASKTRRWVCTSLLRFIDFFIQPHQTTSKTNHCPPSSTVSSVSVSRSTPSSLVPYPRHRERPLGVQSLLPHPSFIFSRQALPLSRIPAQLCIGRHPAKLVANAIHTIGIRLRSIYVKISVTGYRVNIC